MNPVKNKSNRAVESVSTTPDRNLDRRTRQANAKAVAAESNVICTENIGPIECKFLKNESSQGMKLDTSLRYHHIGGGREKWRSNKVWTVSKVGQLRFTQNGIHVSTSGSCNKQERGVSGPKLPSNPLPPFKSNDAKRREKTEKKETKDLELEKFAYVRKEHVDNMARLLIWDDFLTDEQNEEALAKLQERISKRRDSFEELCTQSGGEFETPSTSPTLDTPFLETIVVPKLLDRFARNSDLAAYTIQEWIELLQLLPTSQHSYIYSQVALTPFSDRCKFEGIHQREIGEVPRIFYAALEDRVRQRYEQPPDTPITSDSSDSEEEVIDVPWLKMPAYIKQKTIEAGNFVSEMRQKVPDTLTMANSVGDRATFMLDEIERLLTPVASTIGLAAQAAALSGHIVNLVYDAMNHKQYSLGVLVFKTGFSFSSILSILIPHLVSKAYSTLRTQGRKTFSSEDFLLSFTGNRVLLEAGKTMNAFAQIRNGFRSVRDFAHWIFNHLPTFLQEIIEKYYPDENTVNTRLQTLSDQLLKAGTDIEMRREVTLIEAESIRQNIQELNAVLAVPTPDNRELCNTFGRMKNTAAKIVAYADQFSKLSTPRQAPFSILLYGGTRVGKSVLMSDLASTLCQVENLPNYTNSAYVKQPGVEHWSGYKETDYAVIFDDFLQNTDYEDVTDMFSLATKQHFIVPMASIDDPVVGKKGTLCLTRLVLAATNLENKQAVTTKINCPEALFSRISLRVKVVRKGPYQPDFSHLLFQIVSDNEKGEEVTSHVMKYGPFKRLVVEAMRAHYLNQTQIDTNPPNPDEILDLRKLYTQSGMFTHHFAMSYGVSLMMFGMYGSTHIPNFMTHGYKSLSIATGIISLVAVIKGVFVVYKIFKEDKALDEKNANDVELLETVLLGKAPTLKMLLRHQKTNPSETGDLIRQAVGRLEKLPCSHADYDAVQDFLQNLEEEFADSHVCDKLDIVNQMRAALPIKTESRTLEERTHRRPLVVVESKTEDTRSARRPLVRSEGDPTTHSKFASSPFYSQQDKLREAFRIYNNVEIDDAEVRKLMQPRLITQGCTDPMALSQATIAHERVVPVAMTRTNYATHFAGPVDVLGYVNAIPISSSVLLLPKHFFFGSNGKRYESTDKVVYRLSIMRNGLTHPVDLDKSRVSILVNSNGFPDIDGALYDCAGTSVPAFRSCLGLFVKEEELPSVTREVDATMVGYSIVAGQPQRFIREFTAKPLTKMIEYAHGPDAAFIAVRGFTYYSPTRSGDCGAPVIAHAKSLAGKIVGIHSFGSEGDTFSGATLITQEMITRLIKQPQSEVVQHTVKFTTSEHSNQLRHYAQHLTVEILGEVEQPIYVPRKTVFKPTPFAEHFSEYTSVPSQKHESEGHDPLIVGALLFGSEFNNLADTLKQPCLDYLAKKYRNQSANVLSAIQALNARGGMDRLNLNTSAGYPHVLLGKSKKTFLQVSSSTGEVSFKSPSEAERVQQYVSSWETHNYETIWIVALKDCLDKPNKLCRVFEVPPYEYTIATRAYFGAFIDMIHSTVGAHFCCVGMNPESHEWSEMTYKLLKLSPYGLDADAPNWDKGLSPCIMYWATESINQWYQRNDPNWSELHDNARRNIVYAAIHAFLLAGSMLILKHKGMPSGFGLTAVLNSIANMIMHLIWYLVNAPLEQRSIAFYDNNLVTFIYGDDALDSIRPNMLEFLNRNTMQQTYRRYCSMDITSAVKDAKLVPFDRILDLTFLRRGFRQDGIHYKPLLALRSMYSMLCYTRESKYASQEAQLLENFRVFTAFLYFYGPEYYNDTLAYFGKFLPDVIFPEYSYYDDLYRFGKTPNQLKF